MLCVLFHKCVWKLYADTKRKKGEIFRYSFHLNSHINFSLLLLLFSFLFYKKMKFLWRIRVNEFIYLLERIINTIDFETFFQIIPNEKHPQLSTWLNKKVCQSLFCAFTIVQFMKISLKFLFCWNSILVVIFNLKHILILNINSSRKKWSKSRFRKHTYRLKMLMGFFSVRLNEMKSYTKNWIPRKLNELIVST